MTTVLRPQIRRAALVAALVATTALGACGKSDAPPTGQVVAKVDGTDITRRDISAELAASKANADVDMKAVQGLVVGQIVSRKLFVEEARREGLDKTPEYLAAEQRAQELVLAEMMAKRFASKASPVTPDQAQTFIADNPQMFGQRRVLVLDQIRTATAGLDQKALGALNSADAIVAYLNQRNHPFDRGESTADTLTLPKGVLAQITALPPGMPFVISQGGVTLISTVTAQRPAPVPDAQWTPLAMQALSRQRSDDILKNQLTSLRSAAKIEYQKGFAPPPAAAGAAQP